MKSLVLLVLLSVLVSSCFTYKSISRTDPINNDLLSNLKPGNRYLFDLNSGQWQLIYLTSVSADTIRGYTYRKGSGNKIDYISSFESVKKNVAKISERKHNPYLTGAGILVVVLTTVVIVWYRTSW